MRNIIFIVIDTLRADHLGCYAYPRVTSPFLDSLAERSLVLDACYSTSNFTAPAFTSLFTARYPSHHGIFDFCKKAKKSAIKDCLEASGVRAEGIVTFRFFKNLLSRIWGELEAVTDTRSFDYSKYLPQVVSDAAIEWLEQYGQKGPFCLFLHYDGPHFPYRLPKKYAEIFDSVDIHTVDPQIVATFFPQHLERIGSDNPHDSTIPRLFALIKKMNNKKWQIEKQTRNWLIDKYDSSIRYNDDMLARVYESLQSLGLLNDTIFAVFSDHGEEFFDHGHFGHGGIHVYDEIIRTVGIIHNPKQPIGRRCGLPISHIQILPTLLRQAGIQLPKSLSELDIDSTLDRVRAGRPPEPVFCIGEFKSVVRFGNLKWIHSLPSQHLSLLKRGLKLMRLLQIREIKDELYDIAADPYEQVNLFKGRNKNTLFKSLLKEHIKQNARESDIASTVEDLDSVESEKIEKELKNLGYM